MAKKDEALQKIESHEKAMQNYAEGKLMTKLHSIENSNTKE